ncbi:hypothetical protein [Micromonospora pisi]|nr:hypothetical protein [Micromonospora pisi]
MDDNAFSSVEARTYEWKRTLGADEWVDWRQRSVTTGALDLTGSALS